MPTHRLSEKFSTLTESHHQRAKYGAVSSNKGQCNARTEATQKDMCCYRMLMTRTDRFPGPELPR